MSDLTITLGLLERSNLSDIPNSPIPVVYDLADYDEEGLRVGIFGASGSGKGWLLGLWLEQLHHLGIPIIAIDPESELWTMQEMGALVLGGKHADAPLPTSDRDIRAVMEFATATATPVIFDLGKEEGALRRRRPSELLTLGENIMAVFEGIADDLKMRVAFAVCESHIFAPQTVTRGGTAPELLATLQKLGRKRGVIPIVETQRTASIAKDVISQCNARFVGHLDSAGDYDNVKRDLPDGWTLTAVRALHTGQFIMAGKQQTTPGEVLHTAQREVTHGGRTPFGEEVTIKRRATSEELDSMLAQLRASAAVGDAEAIMEAVPKGPASAARTTEERHPQLAQQLRAAQSAASEAQKQLDQYKRRNTELEQGALRTASELEDMRRRIVEADADQLAVAELRRALVPFVIGGLDIASGDGSTVVMSLDEDGVRRVIKQMLVTGELDTLLPNAGRGGDRIVPVEALRRGFMETAAQRVYANIVELDDDARQVARYLIAHGSFKTGNAVAAAVFGSDGGTARDRAFKALAALEAAGVVMNDMKRGRRESVDKMVASRLGPHNPTAEDIEEVKGRVISLLMESGA